MSAAYAELCALESEMDARAIELRTEQLMGECEKAEAVQALMDDFELHLKGDLFVSMVKDVAGCKGGEFNAVACVMRLRAKLTQALAGIAEFEHHHQNDHIIYR